MFGFGFDISQQAIGVSGGPNVPYTFANANAAAVHTAMTVKPGLAFKQAMDTFVAELEAGSVWADIGELHVFANLALADTLINWKSPGTLDATVVGSPVFTPGQGTQSVPASIADYIASGADLSTTFANMLQDSNHIMVCTNTELQNASVTVGSTAGASLGVLIRNLSDQFSLRQNTATPQLLPNTNGIGRFITNRTGSTASEAFRNAVSLGTSSAVSVALPAGKIGFGRGAVNNNTRRMSVVGLGAGLTAPKIAAYDAALAKFLNAIGAAG